MKKRFLTVFLVLLIAMTSVFAEDAWWVGKQIVGFEVSGINKVSSPEINDILYSFRGKEYSDSLLKEIESRLNSVKGVASIEAGVIKNDDDSIRLVLTVIEKPVISSIKIEGNSKLKTASIIDAITNIKEGDFVKESETSAFDNAVKLISALYNSKGFDNIPVSYTKTINENGDYDIVFTVQEGIQSRIIKINYEGNSIIKSSVLKKQISSKAKSLFNKGYLNVTTLKADENAIALYYQTLGYIDVIVTSSVKDVSVPDSAYRDVEITFKVDEGKQWYFGGLTVTGNTIYSNEDIAKVLTMKVGSVLNLATVQSDYSAVADLYYNNGYISNGINLEENRDDTNMTVSYKMTITEGPQAVIEKILITGLKKTQDYVMRRELELHEGDIFSKTKLITSAQNLYNTGLLSNLDYNLYYGNEENSVIIEFTVEEGSHMDIQFGATFGGSATGFPISGFLKWADHNLGGRGQEFDVSTTLSPDTQEVAVQFGDDWLAGKRWANTLSLSFEHTIYKNQLRQGAGSEMFTGRNEAYPLGYFGFNEWAEKEIYPSESLLMDYHLLTASLGYSTGYTFIFDVGRLSFNAGISGSINKALYEDYYTPFELLIHKYHTGEGGILGWQMSNKFSLGIQWDGRDFTYNTTKGYVISASGTYAGGVLSGLSNYIKVSASAAGYVKVAELGPEENRNNLMFCLTSSANAMLPQYYNHETDGLGWHDAILGATKNEMLYIDGMTIARGHNTKLDLTFLWDNMAELSYPLVKNLLQAEAYVSATGVSNKLETITDGLDWYFSAGAGIKLKVSGFPLGLYVAKTATMRNGQSFEFLDGNLFHSDKRPGSGLSLVLAISTSLI